MDRDMEEFARSKKSLRAIRIATEATKLGFGVILVSFGLYVCYELLQALSYLADGKFVPLVRNVIELVLSDTTTDNTNAVQLPTGTIQVVGLFAYLFLLAIFMTLAKALLSSGIRILSYDNAKNLRDLWVEMRAEMNHRSEDHSTGSPTSRYP